MMLVLGSCLVLLCSLTLYAMRRAEEEVDLNLNALQQEVSNSSQHPLFPANWYTTASKGRDGLGFAVEGISANLDFISALRSNQVSENLMTTYDNLRTVHDAIVRKLGVIPPAWNEPYVMQFRDTSWGRVVNDTIASIRGIMNSSATNRCVDVVGKIIVNMRRALIKLNKLCDEHIQWQRGRSIDNQYEDYEDQMCENQEWGKSGNCWRFDLSANYTDIRRSCETQCNKIPEYKGFSMYVNDRAVEIVKKGKKRTLRSCQGSPLRFAGVCEDEHRFALTCGNKHAGCWLREHVIPVSPLHGCCFHKSVDNAYEMKKMKSILCLKKTSNPFLNLDANQTAAWLWRLYQTPISHGKFEFNIAKVYRAIQDKKLNGPAFMSMGRVKLAEYLSISEDQASLLKCTIDASKAGENPGVCWSHKTFELYKDTSGWVNWLIFFGLKTNFKSQTWLCSAMSKLATSVKRRWGHQYEWAKNGLTQFAGSLSMYVTYVLNNGDLDWVTSQSWVFMGAASIYLIERALNIATESCHGVEQLLSSTDLADERMLNDFVKKKIDSQLSHCSVSDGRGRYF